MTTRFAGFQRAPRDGQALLQAPETGWRTSAFVQCSTAKYVCSKCFTVKSCVLLLLSLSTAIGGVLIMQHLGVPLIPQRFLCHGTHLVKEVVAPERKGFAIDDTTWNGCPSQIPSLWPLTNQPVQGLRLFRATSHMGESAWLDLKGYCDQTGAKVLVATTVTCEQEQDDKDWSEIQRLLRILGPNQVAALAVGNELDLLAEKKVNKWCRVWDYFEMIWTKRLFDLEHMEGGAFSQLPVMTVMSAACYSAAPGNPASAYFKPFEANMFQKIYPTVPPERFIFTFNIYPYFNPCPPSHSVTCDQWRNWSLCFEDSKECVTPKTASEARYAITNLGRNSNWKNADKARLWIGELGWSSPEASTLDYGLCNIWGTKGCTSWSKRENLKRYYTNFLNWDLSIGDGLEPPEFAYYFTIRDSFNYGDREYFGVCGTSPESVGSFEGACDNTTSKI